MFQPKLKLESVEANGLDRLFVKDVTGNHGDIYYEKQGDGTFLQKTNDWGYGAPNPLRSSVAIIFAVVHKQKKKDVWMEVDAYDPTDPLVEKVSFEYLRDGHHQLLMFAIPKFEESTVYQVGDYSFFPDGTKSPYYGDVKILGEDSVWSPVSIQELALDHENVEHKQIEDDVLFAKTYSALKDFDFHRRDSIINGKRCGDGIYELSKEWEGHILLREADRAKDNGHYTLGEKICRAAEIFLKS
jgi:hypothetical protein